jgi:predicted ATP-dependent serine protease
MKRERHPLAGQKVEVSSGALKGQTYRVEDWWVNVSGGKSWMFCDGNIACLVYAIRTGLQDTSIPTDDEVVYGKIGIAGHLLHISELAQPQKVSA